MNVVLNGETADARGATNVSELVERYELSPNAILIEHNGVALLRHEWPQHSLGEGDRVEFVRVVAGG